jgi:hypothetical protein
MLRVYNAEHHRLSVSMTLASDPFAEPNGNSVTIVIMLCQGCRYGKVVREAGQSGRGWTVSQLCSCVQIYSVSEQGQRDATNAADT